MGGRPVFVLEDEVPVRTVLVDALTSVGHDVRDFGDGQQALDEIERVVPDLILLDMRMPVLDGWGFARARRASSEGAEVPLPVGGQRAAGDQARR